MKFHTIIAYRPGPVNRDAGQACIRSCLTFVDVDRQRQESGRGERIRTSGLYVPNVALYQAKLHPDGVGSVPT